MTDLARFCDALIRLETVPAMVFSGMLGQLVIANVAIATASAAQVLATNSLLIGIAGGAR